MIRRPPRSTLSSSSAASDVYKRQGQERLLRRPRDRGPAEGQFLPRYWPGALDRRGGAASEAAVRTALRLSLIHISEPTRLLSISYAVFCLKKKKNKKHNKQ